jgi:predicted type IV restriction endonuclease
MRGIAMKEQLELYVKKVKELHELCRGNEATTKASLIAPLFGLLGFDMADPRECLPEYRADFGRGERAATPVDWAFALNGSFVFIVEAKEAGKKLKSYAEQLGMYFAKASVKLGIYTSGVQWHFYSDLDNLNIMDKEPFLTWDILNDDPLPLDFLTILQKTQFQPQLIRTFAERGRRQNLLVDELTHLLEPSSDFIRLAVKNIETRTLHASVVEEWRPILVNAINEWAKQKALSMALERPADEDVTRTAKEPGSAKRIGKTCPACQETVGNRTRVCKCGHIFVVTTTKPEEVEVEQDKPTEPIPASMEPEETHLAFPRPAM